MAITTVSNSTSATTAAPRYKMAIQLDSATTTTTTPVASSSKSTQPLPPLPPPSNHQAKYSDVPIRLNVDYSRPRTQQSKYQYLPIQLDTKPLPAPRSSPPRVRTQGHVRAIQQHLYPLAAVSPPLPPPLPKTPGSMVRKKVPPRLPAPERSIEDAIAPAPQPHADAARDEDVPKTTPRQDAYAINSTVRREDDMRKPVVRQEVYAVPTLRRREDVTPRLPPAQHEVFLTPTLTRKDENAPKPPIRPDLYVMSPAIRKEEDAPPRSAPQYEVPPVPPLPPLDRRDDDPPIKRAPRQPMYTVMPAISRKGESQQHMVALPAASRSREEIARPPTRKDIYALDHRQYNNTTATSSATQWPPTRTRTPKPVPAPVVVTAPVAAPAITTPYRATNPTPSPVIKDEPLPPLPTAAITVTAPPPSSAWSHHHTHSQASPSPPPSRGARLSPRTPGSARRNNKPPPMTAKLHAMPNRLSGLFNHLSNNLLMESSLDWDQKRVLSMSKAAYLASCPSPTTPRGYSPITTLPPALTGASVPRSVPPTPTHVFPPVSPSSVYTDDNRDSEPPKSPTPLPLFAKSGPPSPYHLRHPALAHAHSHANAPSAAYPPPLPPLLEQSPPRWPMTATNTPSSNNTPTTPVPPPPLLSPAATWLTTSAAIFRLDFHLSRPTVLLLKRVISPVYPYEPLARPVWELPAGPVDDADYCISDAVARCVDRLVGLRVIRISGLLAGSTGPVPRGDGHLSDPSSAADAALSAAAVPPPSLSPRRDRRVGVILDPLPSSMPPPPTQPPTQPLPEPPTSASSRTARHHPPPPPQHHQHPRHNHHHHQHQHLAPPSTPERNASATTAHHPAKKHHLQLHWTVLVESIENVAVRGAEHEEYVWASWNVLQILNMDDGARDLAREALEWAGRCSF